MLARAITMAVVVLCLAGVARADNLVAGFVPTPLPGQPDYEADRSVYTLGYEAADMWRLSFHTAAYSPEQGSGGDIDADIYAVERLWQYEMGESLHLVGGLGPGITTARVDRGGSEDSGTGVGLVATGSFRILLQDYLLDFGYHYRNAAVGAGGTVVDGGYSGLALMVGLRL